MAAALTVLGACGAVDGVFYGARQGTIEYPGSGAGPDAVPVYIVKERDTVDGIAQRFGVSTQTIVDRNRMQPPYPLRAGQTLEIPGAKVVDTTEEPVPVGPPPGGPVQQRESLAPPGGAQPGQPTPLNPAAGQPGRQEVTVAATPPPGPAPRFEWPVRGPVTSGYGTTAGGQRNDGIDIQAAKGTAVKAADSGTVVYAGNEVRGMGNLLLVSHSGGYITAYGFNDQLLVAKGATVKKGQAIAKVGNTGSSAEPRLHFEVRRGNKTIDPQTVLPGQ